MASDLPYFCSLDEMTYIENALRFGTGTFKMSSSLHAALYSQVLFLEYAAYFVLGRVLGLFNSSTDFLLAYIKDPTPFFLLARMTVVMCGVGTVWLSYAIATRVYHQRVGLVASLFTAFSLLMFQMSFLALADISSVFLLLMATYLTVRSVEQPKEHGFYCTAAALVGLAAACKYHTGFGVVTLAVAAFIKSGDYEHRTSAFVRLAMLGSIFVVVGFCVGMPQFLLDPVAFYEDVFHKLGGQLLGHNPGGNAWLFLFTHHLRNGLEIPLELASLLGLGFALYHRSKWDLLMLSFPVSFYFLFMHAVGFAYYLVPAVAFLLILAARFLDAVVEKLWGRGSLGVSLFLAAVVATPTFLDSVRFVQVMRSPNTKMTAKTWIEEHIPGGATIMAEGYILTAPTYGPPLVENPSTVERDIAFAIENKGTGRMATLRLAHYGNLYGNARAYDILKVRMLDSEAIIRNDPRYLITTSGQDSPLGKELAGMGMTEDFGEKREAIKESIRRRYAILATIAPTVAFTAAFPHLMDEDYYLIRNWPLVSRGRSRGPTITIWERRSHGSHLDARSTGITPTTLAKRGSRPIIWGSSQLGVDKGVAKKYPAMKVIHGPKRPVLDPLTRLEVVRPTIPVEKF